MAMAILWTETWTSNMCTYTDKLPTLQTVSVSRHGKGKGQAGRAAAAGGNEKGWVQGAGESKRGARCLFAFTDSTGLPWPAITRKSNRRRLRCIITTSRLRVAKQLCGECPSRLCVSVFTCMCSALFAAIFHQAVPAGAWPGPGDPLTRYLGRRCRATSPYRCVKKGPHGCQRRTCQRLQST